VRLSWAILLLAGHLSAWPFHGHKSSAALARMDGAALVLEYCREVRSRNDQHGAYLAELVSRAGRRENVEAALRALARTLDGYSPGTRPPQPDRAQDARSAMRLLGLIDNDAVRVRSLAAGREVIAAAGAYLARKAKAGEDRRDWAAPLHFENEVLTLASAKDLNQRDHYIRSNLRSRKGITIPAIELRRFIEFLVAKDPRYPSWSALDPARDPETGKYDGGMVIRQLDPYVQALEEFRRASSP
jgi:hypothetical protein